MRDMADDSETMLVVERGLPGVRVNPLDYQVCIIGASPSSDIFVDNPYISRMHAQIVYENQHSRIRDLDSKNGTFVNRTRLSIEEQVLQRGDRIELADGQVLLRFQTRGTTVTIPAASATSNGDLVVDAKSREVWVRGEKLESPLSRKEFDVIELLAQKRGEVCSKDDIAAAGWPEREAGDVGDQEIEQSIRRLRLRIELDPSQPQHIINVRGHGYKLAR